METFRDTLLIFRRQLRLSLRNPVCNFGAVANAG